MKELSPELVKELRLKANQIRRDICIKTSKLPYAHLGGGMSMTDMDTPQEIKFFSSLDRFFRRISARATS